MFAAMPSVSLPACLPYQNPKHLGHTRLPLAVRRPGAPRRVILATPIAESSLTLEGVVSVVDSGLRRAPRFDPATAVNRLDTVR